MKRTNTLVCVICAILVGILAWFWNRTVFVGAYLAAWWFWCGLAMGGLANVWLHNLTGGAWGETIRAPLLKMGAGMWLIALLFVPVLIGMDAIYPWSADAARGAARWSAELSALDFKSFWLRPAFFIGRSIFYLLLWTVLARLTLRPALQRNRVFSAIALIVYGFSVGGAAVDWIMSLAPLWYSSVFGWLTGTGQMLSGMAAAVWLITRSGGGLRGKRPVLSPALSRDLGNLLMMYVMTWAYLSFVQFLIIWAENLPHEIGWYLARAHGAWLAVAWLLALLLFAVPLVLLLFRRIKDAPPLLGALAGGLLLMKLVQDWWLVLPSIALPVPVPAHPWLVAAPLMAIALGLLLRAALHWTPVSLAAPQEMTEEGARV